MSQFEYNDLNKFYVSVGVFLIGFTFVLPWLYMHEQFDLTIKAKELEQLTSTAQEIISNRQRMSGILMWVIPISSFLSLAAGIYLSFRGLQGWSKLQKLLEKREEMINQELSLKIDQLTPKEHEARVEQDIESQEDEGTQTREQKKKLVTSYLEAENTFYELIRPVFKDDFKIIQNTRIGQSEYDIILRSPLKMNQDVVIELKYSEARVGGDYFHHSLNQLNRSLEEYKKNVKDNTIGRLVFLLPHSALHNTSKHPNSILPSKTINLLDNRDKELKGTDVRVAYIDLDELNTYNKEKILSSLKIKV